MRSRVPAFPALQPGATLLELLAAATVFGLFLTMTAPRVLPTTSAVDGGAQVVLNGLLRAQRLAVTEQRNVIVTFDLAERRLVIHLDANHDGEQGPDEPVSSLELSEGVEFGAGLARPRPHDAPPVSFGRDSQDPPRVTFRRNGSVAEAGAVYLWVPGSGADEVRLVTVSRASGRGITHAFDGGEWIPLQPR